MSRPTIMTEITVKKLEEAFALGCSDEEACIYADICKQTLYNYQNKNQEFLDRKELLKQTSILKARKVVIDNLEKNPLLAFKYLERKRKDEFGLDAKTFNEKLPIPIMAINYLNPIENNSDKTA
jgi:hypothetical protein